MLQNGVDMVKRIGKQLSIVLLSTDAQCQCNVPTAAPDIQQSAACNCGQDVCRLGDADNACQPKLTASTPAGGV
jgi:hypothetical protein